MAGRPVRLKFLLQERHWQTYRTFCDEYDKAAKLLDPKLVGTWPSRPQLHRWLSGDLKGLPYPDHCRVLEKIFPGWSAAQLFESANEKTTSTMWSSEAIEGRQLLQAISIGLEMPDSGRTLWGPEPIATSQSHEPTFVQSIPDAIGDHVLGANETAHRIGRKLIALGKVLRLRPDEIRQLAGLAGNVVDLDQTLDVEIDPRGHARLSYRHDLFNMSDRPLTRLHRELWFENTHGPLVISAMSEEGGCLMIQRLHDTINLAKFACQISPSIQPGEAAVIRYVCEGGQFINNYYWRQSIRRYTRHLTIKLRHRDAGRLTNCSATEEHPDGSDNSANEQLIWDYDEDDIVVTFTRDHLRPNQAVTLRWEVER